MAVVKETGNMGHYKIANASTILLILFLTVNSVLEALRLELKSVETLAIVIAVIALVLLISVFRATKNYQSLGFYTSFIFFMFVTVLMAALGWQANNYLLLCVCACGISCLYANFTLTVSFAILQNVMIAILFFLGVPIAGPETPMLAALFSFLIFMVGNVILIAFASTATVTLNKALDEVNSFRTFLSTTANYLAMVDKQNKIIYVSKPLSQLTHIEDPELAKGRSLIDLFPGRELKLLASKMLGQRELYEEDWEFVLDGQKRYFKAASALMAGSSTKGTLINLHDMTHLAERDEIAAMKDSLKIGLCFMDRDFVIQDNYSRYMEELLSEDELHGKRFTDLLSASVTSKELEAIRDYFVMIFDRVFDQVTLEDINPLSELHYVSITRGSKKIFNCEFTTVERNKGETFILITIYDITAKVELQRRLVEEENRRQEEMRSIFELIQVDPSVFASFQEDAQYEFGRIDETLKNDSLSTHEALVEIYQSVHAIKSNAVILGLNTFGGKAHELESKIKALREKEGEEVTFDEMLNLTVEIERLSQTKDGFKDTIERINSFKVGNAEGQKQKKNEDVLIESLTKTASKAADDMGKKVQFVAADIDPVAIEKGPKRVIKEVLMQLIRNSVVHGIETPEVRLAKKKNETGTIRLSIKCVDNNIQIKLGDDGKGLDFNRISEKALSLNMIKPEDANNRNVLLNAIFAPGFSTAETEGVHAGRGIGLNLVRDRVRGVKGSIKLQTEIDKGTVFSLFFPIEETNAEEK